MNRENIHVMNHEDVSVITCENRPVMNRENHGYGSRSRISNGLSLFATRVFCAERFSRPIVIRLLLVRCSQWYCVYHVSSRFVSSFFSLKVFTPVCGKMFPSRLYTFQSFGRMSVAIFVALSSSHALSFKIVDTDFFLLILSLNAIVVSPCELSGCSLLNTMRCGGSISRFKFFAMFCQPCFLEWINFTQFCCNILASQVLWFIVTKGYFSKSTTTWRLCSLKPTWLWWFQITFQRFRQVRSPKCHALRDFYPIRRKMFATSVFCLSNILPHVVRHAFWAEQFSLAIGVSLLLDRFLHYCHETLFWSAHASSLAAGVANILRHVVAHVLWA